MKKSSILSFKRQKANWLTFCTKSSSDHRIWPNRHWNRVEWTQEMVFNTYHHTRTCLDEKIEIDEKNFNFFFLTNFLKGYFKAFPEKPFFSKKHFFVFCRNFGFNLEISSNHYSRSKKQVKVDPETRSYDFLTKTREKNPMWGNRTDPEVTLEYAMNDNNFQFENSYSLHSSIF